jgi:hypothetical protein
MKTITIDGQKYELTPITQEKKLVVKRDFNFEIKPDEWGKMTWYEALEKVKELGDGWRMPTINELQLIWESEHKDLFKKESYWSLSEYSFGSAWVFYFGDSNTYGIDKNDDYYVMAVRDLTTLPQVDKTNIEKFSI